MEVLKIYYIMTGIYLRTMRYVHWLSVLQNLHSLSFSFETSIDTTGLHHSRDLHQSKLKKLALNFDFKLQYSSLDIRN